MKKSNMIKVLGLVATAVGMGATLLTNWVDDKKMEEAIDEKINERFTKEENEDDEEES